MPEAGAPNRPRPLVLVILDGFGERAETDGNAVRLACTPNLSALAAGYPHTLIGTSGPDVGLPPGQMGNSEVGHLNFGAGRIAMMDITRIDAAVIDRSLGRNPVLHGTIDAARLRQRRLHLFGLLSNGGVHSSMEHLFALVDAAAAQNVEVVVHAFLDGRDTPPNSAPGFVAQLEERLRGKGTIGTVSGRFWAMDRDKRWERVHRAFDAIVRGRAARFPDAASAIAAAYTASTTDEFVEPACLGDYAGIIGELHADKGDPEWVGGEFGIGFNFRPDRMREIVSMLTRRLLPPEVATMIDSGAAVRAFDEGAFACMTEYDARFELPVAYAKEDVTEVFPEILARHGFTQLRCAETEKYAHVTYFFNGGREAPFPGEERVLVPSPRDVATYDLKPQMSAATVADQVVAAIDSGRFDFVLVNFANPDMVGHSGVLEAAVQAVEEVDRCIGRLVEATRRQGGALLITADHGNCEQMKDENGAPFTAHTVNPVPLYYVNDADRAAGLATGGRICDVAPTMLELLGLPKPVAMTGRSLLVRGPS